MSGEVRDSSPQREQGMLCFRVAPRAPIGWYCKGLSNRRTVYIALEPPDNHQHWSALGGLRILVGYASPLS
jgi:hypothetical protein